MSQQITSSNLVPATESKNIVMNVLTLIIKKKWLDEILSGEKTTEEREIRPKTIKKYATIVDLATGKSYDNYDDLFAEVKPNDKGFDFVPRKYDALQLYAGYETGRPVVLVEVKSARCIPFFYEDDNSPVWDEYNGQNVQMLHIEYQLGDIISKTNC